MLCVAHSGYLERQQTVSNNMPADFSSYLLSASPPGFDLAYMSSLRDRFNPSINEIGARSPSKDKSRNNFSEDYNEVSQGIVSLLVSDFQSHKSHSLPLAYTGFQSQTKFENNANNNNSDTRLKKKSVSFADEMGKNLVEVRIVYEDPDEAPSFVVSDEMLHPVAPIRSNGNVWTEVAQDEEAAITDTPPLVLNFTQPASNYKNFRAKLDTNNVSLENVIVKEYNLLGTIKVKNISFEKKVIMRYTCDSWKTLCDVEAKYVPAAPTVPGTSKSPHDTFSFQLSIPPNFDPKLNIQFSICYETNGQQFWDNNDGKNYEVIAATQKDTEEKTQDNGVFDLHHDDKWTEFSNWTAVDNSIPYW